MQINVLFFFLLILTLSSCISNPIDIKPNSEEYLQLVDTPVFVKKSQDTDLYAFEDELDECIKTSSLRVNRSSKIGTGFGSYLVLGGLYIIATASGAFAPIFVTAGAMGGVLGGSTIYITNATKEYRKYFTLEKCLEEKGHEIIFYDTKKTKE